MIRNAAADVLAARSASADVRRVLDGSAGQDDALWKTLACELGWSALAIPEAMGGIGLGVVEQVLLMEQLGRRLACVPYFSTGCLAAAALAQCDEPLAATWLERIAQADVRATLALPLDMPFSTQPLTVFAHETAQGFSLSGIVEQVLDGACADLLLVPATLVQDGRRTALFALEAASVEGLGVTVLETLDRTRPLARLTFNGVAVSADTWLGGKEALRILEQTAWRGALALAAEQLGGAQQCLDLTLDYTSQRVQFGRTIASFQAVKHRCAQMLVQLEAARSSVFGAAREWDEVAGIPGSPVSLWSEVAVAKAAANEAYAFCAQEAIQLHGGVGFTWEYDPHLYFKRAQASSVWFGSTPQLLDWLARYALDGIEPAWCSATHNPAMKNINAPDARLSFARRGAPL
ncbi:acyl-CoA dehydrogenase family protein [Paraburkholderia hayleyella]|uniref:acyl-CoA dehydrogenase family protein n=1 Tax=Paraburkholderia hayleyella TaxID=2152889 RepID=UPI003CCCCE9F